MPDPSQRRPHNMDLVTQILAGEIETEQTRRLLGTPDRKGLTPVSFAVMAAAKNTAELLALKALLDPPAPQEQSQMDQVLDLLEQIATSQARVEESQARQERLLRQIASALGGRPKASPQPQDATRTGSAG